MLAIEREAEGERLLALFNFAGEDLPAPVGEGTFDDLWSGARVSADGLRIPAGGFLWLTEAAEA